MAKKKYTYGKAHHEKSPYKMKVFVLFKSYMENMQITDPNSLRDHRVNNLLIDLRNEVCNYIDEIYSELSLRLKYGIEYKKNTSKKAIPRGEMINNKLCEICDEDRAINLCHIVPREDGGPDTTNNYFFLCPTHHYLFDQGLLNDLEFRKLNVSGKSDMAKKYFIEIHKKRHELFLKYNTNKFVGCNCGSKEFAYCTFRNGNVVQIALKCKICGEVWLNLWRENHPNTRASIPAFDPYSFDLDQSEKENAYLKAETQLMEYIRQNLEN